MFRITSKFPRYFVLYRNCSVGLKSNRPEARNYSAKEQQPLCPPPKPKPSASTGTAYTLGALAIVGIATIGYAKYDQDFRDWLGENVPYADGFLAVVLHEGNKSIMGSLRDLLEKIQTSLGAQGRRRMKPIAEGGEYTPPRSVFPALVQEEKEEPFNEIRVTNDAEHVEIVLEKPEKLPDEYLSPTHPRSLVDLEQQISESATSAMNAYGKALVALKDYNRDIEVIVEDSVEKLDQNIWKSLKTKTDLKNSLLTDANRNADEASQKLDRLRELLEDSTFEGPEGARATVRRNINRYMDDMKHAKNQIAEEKKMADVTEKYWRKVEAARCHFIEELEILFPEFDIAHKKLSVKQGDIDLFILHAFANVLFYQKELYKVESLGQSRLRSALEAAKKGDPNFSVVEIHIQNEIEQEKRKLAVEYQKKCLALRQASEKELRHRLKCQAEAHQDHLADMLATREQELERQFNRKLDEEIAKEQLKYKMQLAGMVGRMKGMRNAIKERVEADKIAHQSQVLWSACQALHRAVKSSIPGVPWKEQVKPLESEIEAIQKAAAEGDELVQVVLAAIPAEAIERGVFPEDAIRERFLKVERVAKRLALIPENGGRLPLFLLSFVQSALLIQATNPIPQSELADERTDFSRLDTYDILQRARYWLDRGNYMQTLRYMNLLKGASRCVASDWMKETRILLETQQAAETLMAHAVAGGLLHL